MKKLGEAPLVDASAKVASCELGRFTEVGERTRLLETQIGDYSYVVNDSDIAYTTIGKFCSIASHVRINPGNIRWNGPRKVISPIAQAPISLMRKMRPRSSIGAGNRG